MKVVSDFLSHFGKKQFSINTYSSKQIRSSAEDRCRHYMINQLKNSKYNVIGEAKVHKSLDELIDYYRTVNLSFMIILMIIFLILQHELSNWTGHLTDPCRADWSQYDHESLMPIQNATIHRPYHVKNIHSRPHVRPVESSSSKSNIDLTVHF